MPRIEVTNETDTLLCLMVEPWGTDHWMKPHEAFTVVASGEESESPFSIVSHGDGINVWVNIGGEWCVVDREGRDVPCGHQRPIAGR